MPKNFPSRGDLTQVAGGAPPCRKSNNENMLSELPTEEESKVVSRSGHSLFWALYTVVPGGAIVNSPVPCAL